MGVTVSENPDGKRVTISVNGRFDFSCHQDFVKAYKSYPKGERDFVVDLDKTDYMDSSAMGMLLLIREHTASQQVALENCNDSVRELLKVANFDKLFTIQ